MIAAFGIGLLLLLYWYIQTRATMLSVTDHDITYERGILSKDRTSVALRQVRSVRVAQGPINRIFGVGKIEISSTGDQPEFTVRTCPTRTRSAMRSEAPRGRKPAASLLRR